MIKLSEKIKIGDSLPSSGTEGDLFYNTTDHTYYYWDGSAWVAIGGTSGSTTAANVGAGPGQIFRNKTGSVINLRTLANTDGAVDIQTIGDEVQINLASSGPSAPVVNGENLGGGEEVFKQKSGNRLQFRTLANTGSGVGVIAGTSGDQIQFKGLRSPDGSVSIADSGGAIDLQVDAGAVGAVTNGQNLGGGYEVFKDKSGTLLRFRTLQQAAGDAPIISGYGADTINIRAVSNTGVGTPLVAVPTPATIRIKGLRSSDGSVSITDDGDSLDLRVAGGGGITGAANVGGGAGEIYRDITSGTLNLRTIEGLGRIGVSTWGDVVTVEVLPPEPVISDNQLLGRTYNGVSSGTYLLTSPGHTTIDDFTITIPEYVGLIFLELEFYARIEIADPGYTINEAYWKNPWRGSKLTLAGSLEQFDPGSSGTFVKAGSIGGCSSPCVVHSRAVRTYMSLDGVYGFPTNPYFFALVGRGYNMTDPNPLDFYTDSDSSAFVFDATGPANIELALYARWIYVQ